MINILVTKFHGNEFERTCEKTELHCPQCGNKNVVVENSEGDYYEGPNHYCLTCFSEFTMPSWGENINIKIND